MLYAQCLLSDIWNCARYILNQKLLDCIGVFYKSQAFFLMLYKSFNLTRWKKTILPVAATAPRSHIINSLSVSFSCMFSIHLLLRLQLMVHRWIFVHDTHFLCKFFSLWRYDILKKLYVFIKTKENNLYWFIMNLTWFINRLDDICYHWIIICFIWIDVKYKEWLSLTGMYRLLKILEC